MTHVETRPLDPFLMLNWRQLVQPIADAISEQAPAVRDALWNAIDAGDLTYAVLPDGRLRFSAGGMAFCVLECVGLIPVAADNGRTH